MAPTQTTSTTKTSTTRTTTTTTATTTTFTTAKLTVSTINGSSINASHIFIVQNSQVTVPIWSWLLIILIFVLAFGLVIGFMAALTFAIKRIRIRGRDSYNLPEFDAGDVPLREYRFFENERGYLNRDIGTGISDIGPSD